jgi:competence protein ComEC
MAAAPIVAFHFQQLSPWAAAASVLLAPVVFLTIVVAGMKVVLTAVLPWGSSWWAEAAGASARLLRSSVETLAAIPGGEVGVPGLWGWAAVVGVLGLCVPLLPGMRSWGRMEKSPGLIASPDVTDRAKHTGRKLRTGAWTFAAAMTVGLPMLPLLTGHRTDGLSITVLSVGSAQSIVLSGTALGRSAVVIDCGSNGGDVYRRIVEPFLRSRGVGRVEALVLTHTDSDHTSGAEALLRRRSVGQLVIGEGFHASVDRDEQIASGPAGRAMRAAGAGRVPVRVVSAGEVMDFGAVRIDVLHPAPANWRGLSDNDASLVLRVQYAGRVVLIGSDVEETGQRMLLNEPALLRADVLIAPHHGSWEPTLLPLVQATEATTVILSDDNRPTRAQTRFLDEAAGVPGLEVVRTSLRGAAMIEIRPDGTLRTAGWSDQITTSTR